MDNPADVGSRGALELPYCCFQGPVWLADRECWPDNIDEGVPKEVDVERRISKEKMLLEKDSEVNPLYVILEKFSSLTELVRVTAWLSRFINNIRSNNKEKGELSSHEIVDASNLWIKWAQTDAKEMDSFQQVSQRLNIVPNTNDILICRGRISGEYHIFLPSSHRFTELVIRHAHCKTAHGLVGLTMAEIRKNFWIEKLRSRVKSVIGRCSLCKIYHCKPYPDPQSTTLPDFRTTASRAFENVGIDFAGQLEYKDGDTLSGKAYVALYTCATSRAVYLDLLEDMSVAQFRPSLKGFMARRGNPSLIISDNAKTFENTAKWLRKAQKDPEVISLLVDTKVTWKFYLSRSHWWVGFFEQMVGLTKRVLHKALGRARLTFDALKEVLLNVEVILNNRPEDIQLPVLTQNMLNHGINVTLPGDHIEDDPDVNVPEPSKLARHLKRCKDLLWCRWKDEYLRALRDKHHIVTGGTSNISVSDIVLIKDEDKNRGKWKLGLVTKLIQKDDVTLGAKLKTKVDTIIERSVKHLYPLELNTDIDTRNNCEQSTGTLTRSKRDAKSKASDAFKSTSEYELIND